MPRLLRTLSRAGELVEITCRTFQSRSLLKPSHALCKTFVGVLGRAQELYPVRLHGIACLSNHVHLLISPDDVEQMSRFMQHLKTNLTKEIGRLHDWRGSLWDRRYTSIPVSDEPGAQIGRLEYLLSQGCKEGLVLSPRDWPGVHCASALLDGEPLVGEWIDRSAYYRARQKDPDVSIRNFVTTYEVEIEPLPCWQHLDETEWRSRVAEIVGRIEQETLEMHERHGTVPLGALDVQKVDPHRQPNFESKSPRPMVHAFTKRARDKMIEGYRFFEVAYREASRRFRDGEWNVRFPPNCWKPVVPVPG